MRLFIAADLGAPVLAAAQGVIAELRARVDDMAPAARVTWIPPPLMHLTIRFIGEVAEDLVGAVVQVIAEPLPASPFAVEIAGVGAFSSRGVPRVIWGGLRHGTAALRRVERLVSDRLQSLGIPPDEREFTPHLTLARVRESRGLRTERLLTGYQNVAFGTSMVDAITLFESRLSSNGPTYVPLHRTPLGH